MILVQYLAKSHLIRRRSKVTCLTIQVNPLLTIDSKSQSLGMKNNWKAETKILSVNLRMCKLLVITEEPQ